MTEFAKSEIGVSTTARINPIFQISTSAKYRCNLVWATVILTDAKSRRKTTISSTVKRADHFSRIYTFLELFQFAGRRHVLIIYYYMCVRS